MASMFNLRVVQVLVIITFLILGVTMSLIAPFSEGPDEVAHFQFARFVAKHGGLPTTLKEKAEAGYKSDWPPLFHLLVGFAGQGIDLDSPPFVKVAQNNPRLQLVVGHKNIISWRALTTEDPFQGEVLLWYLGRWITLICGLAGIGATYLLIHTIYPGKPWLALSAATLLAFLPIYARISGLISYEPLLGALLTFYFLLLYYTLQNPTRNWLYLALGLALGLASLVKHTPMPAVPMVFLFVLWLSYRQKWCWRVTGWRLALVSLGLMITVGSWFFYMIFYFNRIAESGWISGLIYPFLISDGSDATSMRLAGVITSGNLTILESRGYNDTVWQWFWRLLDWGEGPLSWLLIGLWIVAIAGFVRQWRLFTGQQKLWLLLLVGHIILLLVLPFLRFFLTGQAATGMSQHIIFPVGAVMILLLIQGVVVWVRPNRLAIILSLIAVVYLGQTTVSIIRSYTPAWPIQTVPVVTDEQVLAVFRGLSLIDYRYEVDERTVKVSLQWRAEELLNDDYRVELSLFDAADKPQVRWIGQPLNGRYPTRAWAPGDRVRDLVHLPIAGLPAGSYSLQLRVLDESGVIAAQQVSESQVELKADTVRLKPITLSPVSTPLSSRTVSLAEQTIGYTLWDQGQPVVDTVPFYHENSSLFFTVVPTPEQRETGALRLKLVGPGQEIEPIDQTGLGYNFIVEPSFASGEYMLRFEEWSGQQLVAQIETPPLLRIETESRQFTLSKPISQPLSADFAGYVALLGYDLPQRRVQPGDSIPLTLYWQALRNVGADLIMFTRLVDANQKVWGGRDRMAREVYSTMLWAPKEIVTDPFTVQVDANAPAGIYNLSVGLYLPVGEASVSVPLRHEGQLSDVTQVTIGPIKIGKTPPNLALAAAQPQVPVNQPFGNSMELKLLGYDWSNSSGSDLYLRLYWQVEAPLNVDYTTFVHLRDASGELVAQQDQPPLKGAYPTSLWDQGEIIADEITLSIPPTLTAGRYEVVVGLYNPVSGERLTVPGSSNQALSLREIEVP